MRKIKTHLPNGPALVALKPGVKEPDVANDVLYNSIRNMKANHVFVAGPGSIASALWAARTGATITLWTDNVNVASCVKDTFQLAELAQPILHLKAGFDGIQTSQCDLALIHLPRGRLLQCELLQAAAAVLREGGKLVFVGAKNEGVKGAVKVAREIFHDAGITAQKGGYHVGMAQRPPGEYPLPQLIYEKYNIEVDENPTVLVSCSGVFAPDHLDGGARTLIEGMSITAGMTVLDMGCGTGLIGLSALRKEAKVTLTDVSARAIESARRTCHANGQNPDIIHTSGAEKCNPGEFDAVLTNPPFHKGYGVDYETTRYLLDQAAHILQTNGSLYLVANTFLKYGPWIQQNFSNVQVIYENSQFKVWHGTKTQPPRVSLPEVVDG